MAFRVCSIGCGALATSVHGPSFRMYAGKHPDVELTACCDLDEARALAYRGTFGFARHYTDFREMLKRERPDGVCLIAPVALTAELSCAVMEMGFPLLMEKPPGLTRAECAQMIAVAERRGVPNQVSFNRRYTPLVVELKKRLTAKFSPADIQNVRYDFFRVERRDADFSTTAIHGIDAAKFLAGSDYAHVRFRYQDFPELGPTTASIFMDCEFESGASAQLSFCPVAGVIIERATVNAHNHTFFLSIPISRAYDCPGRLLHVEKGETKEDISGDTLHPGAEMFEQSGFYGENASFLDDLRAGRRPVGDIRSGLQSVEIAECIRLRHAEYRA